MMATLKSVGVTLAMLSLAVILIYAVTAGDRGAAQAGATPTWYHEGFPSPAATSATDQGHHMPLPSAQDQATANAMTDAGIAMIRAAQSMEAAAAIMIASGDPTLVDLGQHWQQDAAALRTRGAWMSVTATSDSMIHDPDKAQELDIANLEANGLAMEAEGEAMADHGRAMIAEVARLRADGSLPADVADDLTARGNDLIAAGERMAKDGQRMQDAAESLRTSLGQ